MPFSDMEATWIQTFVGRLCKKRSPQQLTDQLALAYRFQGQSVLLYERRRPRKSPGELTETPVAKLKFVRSRNEWRLYWMRANGRWDRYETKTECSDLRGLLAEVDRDVDGCFFG